MATWPLSGISVPARICINVDLPAPLCPTSPTHSPVSTAKSTPARARTAPKCFSTPSKLTIFTPLFFHIGLDRLLCVILSIFVAGDTSDWNVGERSFEIILREGEVRNDQVMWNVLAAVQDLLSDPEGESRDPGRN